MDKIALKNKIRALEGLTNDEKAALLELLNKQKKSTSMPTHNIH